MTPTPNCTHPLGHLFDFVRNETVHHIGRINKSRSITGKYRCTRCFVSGTGLPNAQESDIPRKTCLSCGGLQNNDGSLPCGH